jgi:DnaK suppressor protein
MSSNQDIDKTAARQRLQALRDELLDLSLLSAQDRDAVELDQQSVGRLSRMDAMQRQAMAQANERARASEMQRIEQALRRLDEDEYGWCVRCGEMIAAKRLEVDPSTPFCVDCAGGGS